MKSKYVVYAVVAIVAVVLLAYFFNLFQLRMEQSIGKFFTWTIIVVMIFFAGWITGRLSRSGK